ncbi:MAG: hypothetical protein GX033_06585 [Firmicutes bacterium]|nr:hypothetical protein [Bacillota bacterium]
MSDAFLNSLVSSEASIGRVVIDYDADRTFRLQVASRRPGTATQPSPITATWSWSAELCKAIALEAEQLAGSLFKLRQVWQPVKGDADWEQAAPSLLVGWLLWHVGSLHFLQLLELDAAAVDLSAAQQEQTVLLSFLRLNPDNGVVHLQGGPYESGWMVRQVISQRAVRATLASADAEGELLLYTQEPLRQLHAYVEEKDKPFYPSTYRLALPVLSAASLRVVGEELSAVSRQLRSCLWRLVYRARESFVDQEMRPGQWLYFYSLWVGKMTNFWLEAQLLPPVVPFEPNQRRGWVRRRQAQPQQQPPCGLCFWRDVDGLWELGQELL